MDTLIDIIIEDKANEYICDCGYVGGSNTELINHLKSHCKEQPEDNEIGQQPINKFMCALCYVSYDTIPEVKTHMINEHNMREKRTEPCEQKPEENDVEEEKKRMEEWLKQEIHLKELKVKLMESWVNRCTIKGCSFRFESIEKLDLHLKCHSLKESKEFNKNVRSFKCFECSNEFSCWRHCGVHLWKVHKVDVDMLKCPLCSTYKALTPVKILQHLQIHGSRKNFACSLCPKTFPQYSQLRNHSIVHMDKKEQSPVTRWYSQKTCDICLNVFATSKTLTRHMKRHNKIMSYRCNICGKPSSSKSTWLIHMRQHTGEKPLKCKLCPFNARDPSVLRKHMMRHTATRPYKCKICDYNCIQSAQLKHHIKKFHPSEYEKLKCSLCSSAFINETHLERHLRDHKAGLVKTDEEAKNTIENNDGKKSQEASIKPNEASSDCFLPLESMDSMAHDPPVDIGGVTFAHQVGVTIPAHSEDTQFTIFNTTMKNS